MALKSSVKTLSLGLAAALGVALAIGTQAAPQQPVPADQQMQKMLQMYTPELREKVKALSPETRKQLLEMLSIHTNRSTKATFRQVMQEVLNDYQAITAGIATDNAEMTADAARRLANHRLPKGGLYPYFALDNINDADMTILPAMNAAVEGSALKLAEAADRGDMATAATHLSEIMTGCVGCHAKFRGQPGVSDRLLSAGQ
ncbi:MAG: hypothetical protein K8I04_08140 [Gammaproteobacteria bacterium]|nr:hypothetical protein [Gammaproteobacteria bacterium]